MCSTKAHATSDAFMNLISFNGPSIKGSSILAPNSIMGISGLNLSSTLFPNKWPG